MEPYIVDQAPKAPGQCLFSQDIDGPWIDTGLVAPWVRPHGYLSVKYVERLAKKCLDFVPRSEVFEGMDKIQAQLDRLGEEIAALQETVESFEQLQSATDSMKELERMAA
jgi:hypothetical protein